MDNLYFLCMLMAGYVLSITVCLKFLSGERWQIMAAVPMRRVGECTWSSTNLTFYGFFLSTSVVCASALFMVLMSSLRIPAYETVLFLLAILSFCLPASKFVARLVEKKKHTLTVGGASFVGLLVTPIILLAGNMVLPIAIPITPAIAAMAVSYALGEGLGRIACISFGCCYGKPLVSCPAWLSFFFRRWPAIFYGTTKKVSYEGKLEGVPLVPVQAVSSFVNGALCIGGIALFSQGYFLAAMCLCLVGTQLWRTVSEFLRADFRGGGMLSAYQLMSVAAIVFTAWLCHFLPQDRPAMVDLANALLVLWNPFSILFFQVLWLVMFMYTGRSMVTGATVNFHVNHHLV